MTQTAILALVYGCGARHCCTVWNLHLVGKRQSVSALDRFATQCGSVGDCSTTTETWLCSTTTESDLQPRHCARLLGWRAATKRDWAGLGAEGTYAAMQFQ